MFVVTERGKVEIKGKGKKLTNILKPTQLKTQHILGECMCYFLEGKESFVRKK